MPAIWPAVGRAGEFDRSLSTRFSELLASEPAVRIPNDQTDRHRCHGFNEELAIEPAVSGVVTSHVDYSGWKLQ
jgi:hypothetical protein